MHQTFLGPKKRFFFLKLHLIAAKAAGLRSTKAWGRETRTIILSNFDPQGMYCGIKKARQWGNFRLD